jgi:hypothetical protein
MQVTKTPAFVASRIFAHSVYSKALFQLGHTLAIYIVTIGVMFASLSLNYGITLLLALPAAAAYLRLS